MKKFFKDQYLKKIIFQISSNRISKTSKREKTLKPKNMPNEPPKPDNKPKTVVSGDSLMCVYFSEG